MPDKEIAPGIHASVIDADYEVDKSKPCKHGLGDIDSCGKRKDGSMFPYCAIGDIGENRCPQVRVKLKLF